MSQCVPQCERDGGLPRYPHIHHCSMIQDGMSDYVVSELTWEKGHLARHGLHTHPVPKHPTFPGATSSEKPLPSGTLEALVDQVTNPGAPNPAGSHLVPWLGAPASPFPAPDALVPSAKPRPRPGQAPRPGHVLPNPSATTGTGGSRAGSCSGRKRARVGAGDGDRSATGSVASIALAFNGDEAGFATSAASPPGGSPGTENTSCGRPASFSDDDDGSDDDSDDDSDEEGKSKNEKVTSHVSTKRNRTAAIHNQSERKRRDRINQRMRTLQKLVPNSSKTDKASILDEVIGYMKQLQAQVQMMNSMNRVPHMVMPMAMQQLQVAMMAQMAQMAQVGMATGMMGVRTLGGGGVRQPAVPWGAFFPPLLPADIPGRDQLQAPGGALLPDLSTAFMPCQTHQPMAVDAYRSMAALYQQLYQLPPGS